MSITRILERHQALMAEASRALDFRAPTAETVQLPLRQQEQRIETLKRRLNRLEQTRRQYDTRIDSEIAAVRDELEGARTRLDEGRRTLAPVADARPPTGTRPISAPSSA